MKKLLSLTAAILTANAVNAADLSTIYSQAVANDAEIAAARAQRDAGSYGKDMARGALLPQASISYTYEKVDNELEAGAPLGTIKSKYDTKTLQLQASQVLFDLNAWHTYKNASTGDKAADLQLQLAEQQLLLRSAQAYFNVLRAKDNLATAQAQEKAVKRSLEQTKQRFDVGLIAITDVHEAQAMYDLAYVNLLGTEAALDISYEALEQLTGEHFDRVAPLQEDVEMGAPVPADVNEWVTTSTNNYIGIKLAEANQDSVRSQRSAARSKHAPTVKLYGSYVDTETYQPSLNPNGTLPVEGTTWGIQASMPLLAGGSLYSQSKQASQNYAAAEFQAEAQRREAKQNVRSLFRQVQTDTLNVKARKQSITSAQSALEATETGYEVGTRNIVEVLNAQGNLYSAQRDYHNARYDYILNLLNLKFYAGTLDEADIQALNTWLAPEA